MAFINSVIYKFVISIISSLEAYTCCRQMLIIAGVLIMEKGQDYKEKYTNSIQTITHKTHPLIRLLQIRLLILEN